MKKVNVEDVRSNCLKKEICENCMEQLKGVLDDRQLERFADSLYEATASVVLERRQ